MTNALFVTRSDHGDTKGGDSGLAFPVGGSWQGQVIVDLSISQVDKLHCCWGKVDHDMAINSNVLADREI